MRRHIEVEGYYVERLRLLDPFEFLDLQQQPKLIPAATIREAVECGIGQHAGAPVGEVAH